MTIKLTVEDQEFLIDTNELGEPQIRKSGDPIVTRDCSATACLESKRVRIDLKVEGV